MATQQPGFSIGTLTAAADLSAKQFYAVRVSAAQQVNVPGSAGLAILGILQNKPESGKVADVMVTGVTKVKAGAAISAGARVMADNGGKIITLATSGSVGIGFALEAAGADGDIISIALNATAGDQES